MAYKIAGGTKWWQVRAGAGVEGEWIVLKKDWKEYQRSKEKEREDQILEQIRAKEGMVGEDGGVDGSGHCEFRSVYARSWSRSSHGQSEKRWTSCDVCCIVSIRPITSLSESC